MNNECALLARNCMFGKTDPNECFLECDKYQSVTQYLNSLKIGERVIETGMSCMYNHTGTIVASNQGDYLCVRWDRDDQGVMTTNITHGTRRISEE